MRRQSADTLGEVHRWLDVTLPAVRCCRVGGGLHSVCRGAQWDPSASRDDISYRERTESPILPTAVALPCAGLAYAAAPRPRAHGPAESSEEGEHVLVDRGARAWQPSAS